MDFIYLLIASFFVHIKYSVADNAWRVGWVLHLLTRQRSCTPGTRHCATSRASDACFYSAGSVATKQSRPQPSRLQDIESRPAASVSVTGAQHWRTQAAFGARLARHGWPDHHWQCNWWVAWPSSCLCAGKGWTLWTNAVTFIKTLIIIQQCDNERFICDCVNIIRFTGFICDFKEILTLEFPKVVWQHT